MRTCSGETATQVHESLCTSGCGAHRCSCQHVILRTLPTNTEREHADEQIAGCPLHSTPSSRDQGVDMDPHMSPSYLGGWGLRCRAVRVNGRPHPHAVGADLFGCMAGGMPYSELP
eukprot:363087-Chlamydomonas_euryale.AAC.1